MFHIVHFCIFEHFIFSAEVCRVGSHLWLLENAVHCCNSRGTLDILRHVGDVADAQDGWYCVVCSSQYSRYFGKSWSLVMS